MGYEPGLRGTEREGKIPVQECIYSMYAKALSLKHAVALGGPLWVMQTLSVAAAS